MTKPGTFTSDYQPTTEAKVRSPRMCRDAIVRALLSAASGGPSRRLTDVAAALVRRAARGDVAAAREVFDRVDGKVPHQIANDESGGFKLVVSWEK